MILQRHLVSKHAKKLSWLEENRGDLLAAHLNEHNFGQVGHGLNDPLTAVG